MLHKHHSGEDAGLWPWLIEHGTDEDRGTLEAMETEHDAIDPLLALCANGFARLKGATDEDARAALAVRLVATRETLGRHLEHEECDAITIIQRLMTQEDWDAIDEEHFKQTMSPRFIAKVVPWAAYDAPRDVLDDVFAKAGFGFKLVWFATRRRFAAREARAFRYVGLTEVLWPELTVLEMLLDVLERVSGEFRHQAPDEHPGRHVEGSVDPEDLADPEQVDHRQQGQRDQQVGPPQGGRLHCGAGTAHGERVDLRPGEPAHQLQATGVEEHEHDQAGDDERHVVAAGVVGHEERAEDEQAERRAGHHHQGEPATPHPVDDGEAHDHHHQVGHAQGHADPQCRRWSRSRCRSGSSGRSR